MTIVTAIIYFCLIFLALLGLLGMIFVIALYKMMEGGQ
jgi:hypothetical protein